MYIDLFVIQNLIYDYLILSGVAILIGEKFKYPRLIMALLLNLFLSLLAFVYLPFFLAFIPLLPLKIMFNNKNSKGYFRAVIYFYCLSMFLNGVMNTLTYFVSFGVTMLPYVLVALSLSFAVTLIYVMKTRWIVDQESINQFTHEVRIFCGQTEIKGWGFVDTGNHLMDTKTSSPVMIVPKEKLATTSIDEFLNQHRLRFWETNYSVINDQNQSLLVFKPTLLIINETIVHNVVVGVVEHSFLEYDFLLQPSIVRYV